MEKSWKGACAGVGCSHHLLQCHQQGQGMAQSLGKKDSFIFLFISVHNSLNQTVQQQSN